MKDEADNEALLGSLRGENDELLPDKPALSCWPLTQWTVIVLFSILGITALLTALFLRTEASEGSAAETWESQKELVHDLVVKLWPQANEEETETTEGEEHEARPPRYAFATFLSGFPDNKTTWGGHYAGANPQYLDGTRLLNYQLRHAPGTRSRSDIPFISLVAADVPQGQRDQLTKEGSAVVEGKYLTPEWIAKGLSGRWKNVMVKLNLFGLTQFDKICFLDADTLVVQRMDGIFDDPATDPVRVRRRACKGEMKDDESRIPDTYIFAGVPERRTSEHPIPPTECEYKTHGINAGFFCIKPGREIFEYYMSVLAHPYRFWPQYPEQNMLSYAHRPDGCMPWTRLDWRWNTNDPTWKDAEAGVRSLHAKVWLEDGDIMGEHEDPELHRMWWYQKRDMDAFYEMTPEFRYVAEESEVDAVGDGDVESLAQEGEEGMPEAENRPGRQRRYASSPRLRDYDRNVG